MPVLIKVDIRVEICTCEFDNCESYLIRNECAQITDNLPFGRLAQEQFGLVNGVTNIDASRALTLLLICLHGFVEAIRRQFLNR